LEESLNGTQTIEPECRLTLTHVDDDDMTVVSVYTPEKSKVKEAVSKNKVGQDQCSPKNNKEESGKNNEPQENSEHHTKTKHPMPRQVTWRKMKNYLILRWHAVFTKKQIWICISII
jgi:hypothetical protein